MNTFQEPYCWQAELLAEANAVNEFSNIKEKFVIDGNADYPEPEYLIRIGDVPTLPKGNLVAVSAKWKNGKTFFCDILSAIFLGSDTFTNCESLVKQGKVRFIDTEQAKNDTARILKTIRSMTPEDRHGDIEVSCLRDADIDTGNESDGISRYEFVQQTIEIEHPDLVIIDGIADLIYNYNDVFESQQMVNQLATLANKNNCCIVVVMHQNKGSHDKMMKGHIGTMLYQKCSGREARRHLSRHPSRVATSPEPRTGFQTRREYHPQGRRSRPTSADATRETAERAASEGNTRRRHSPGRHTHQAQRHR